MTKRQADESLEEVGGIDSPVPKKSRRSKAGKNSRDASGSTPNASTIQPLDVSDLEHDDEDEDETAPDVSLRQAAPAEGYNDLYLDTIDRSLLDFDFEKLCSITLSNINVYACLVCGKYFQGRGHKSHAYFHALELGHHVYINLATKKVYVLPEGYEVRTGSLDDIKYVVDPVFTKSEVSRLDREERHARDLAGKAYIPGFVGMNNIKENDYFNVIIHTLAHIPPLRNFFMLEDLSKRSQLAQRFSILIRKIWNPKAFKSHVSPHELLQEISLRSGKRYTLMNQADPVDFLGWFLNNLHLAVGGSKTRPGSSIIHKVFQGTLQIESQQITTKADAGDRLRFEDAGDVKVDQSRYLILTLDLPPAPLFQDEFDQNIIPQVPLLNLLSKYDGRTPAEYQSHRRRFRLLHPLPPFLSFHIKRFSSNKFVSERNPTIVTFPLRSLDVSPYVQPNPSVHPVGEPIWYDLVANVVHEAVRSKDEAVEGEKEGRVWKVQLRDRVKEEWISVQDLWVEKIQNETLFLGESYLQVWERRKEPKKT